MMIRQSASQMANDLLNIDWGYAYGKSFDDPLDYPWQVVFHSDQTAAANEAQTTKQTRMNTLLIKTQVITAIKETGINEQNMAMLLEKDGGMDYDEAQSLAKDMAKTQEEAKAQMQQQLDAQNGINPANQNDAEPNDDDDEDGI